MFPNLSQADCDGIERRWDDVRQEVARSRRSRDLTVVSVGRDWGVSRRPAAVTLLAMMLFLGLFVAWPWLSQRVFVAESPAGPAITLGTGEGEPGLDAASGFDGRHAVIPMPIPIPVAVEGAAKPDPAITRSYRRIPDRE